MLDIEKTFDKYDDEFLHFDDIKPEERFSNRPDLHAFILLDKLLPGKTDIVSAAEHDIIFLDINTDGLAYVAKEEHIRDLVRCGVFFDDEFEGLALFT